MRSETLLVRLEALAGRGVPRGILRDLWDIGDEDMIAELERATDAQLAVLADVYRQQRGGSA